MMFSAAAFGIFSLLFASSNAAILTDLKSVNGQKYDFVVVGAGIGGAVVASRLTEVKGFRVLLVEAGGSDADIPLEAIPLQGFTLAPNKPWTWNYTTIPQPELANRSLVYPRGKALGGTTTVNYMLLNKGPASEWDRLAKISGDSGWSYKSVAPYLKKWERFVPPMDGHNTTNEVNTTTTGYTGPVAITAGNYRYSVDDISLQAASQNGIEIHADVNDGYALGIGRPHSFTGGGIRVTSATAYLHAGQSDRKNFDILIGATVTNLVYTSSSGTPIVSGVAFSAGKGQPSYTVTASNEVILSAGSINTPQILQLSGIGPKAVLSKFKIPVRADLPVGENLSDHSLIALEWAANSTDTWDTTTTNTTVADAVMKEWDETKKGKLSDTGIGAIGWSRIEAKDPIYKYEDPTSGLDAPHMETLFCSGYINFLRPTRLPGNFHSIIIVNVAPKGRGSVNIVSADPFAAPEIYEAYLTTPWDVYAHRYQLKKVFEIIKAPAYKGYIGAPVSTTANIDITSDASIDDFIRNDVTTTWHASGTASMGPKGVVNADLTVKGVKKLRIVDMSVLPAVSQGHPSGPLYTISERAADLIKAAYSK